MIDEKQIVLISYPSGGFGNFIYYVLTEFADQTYKVDNSHFKFAVNGNSHSTKKYLPIWYKDPENYKLPSVFTTDKTALILCDNGIDNDSYKKIRAVFQNCKILRLCISESVRPIIYKTCIIKAKNTNLIDEIKESMINWGKDKNEDYAIRENYTLFYHNWPFNWQPLNLYNIINIDLENLIFNTYETIMSIIQSIGARPINTEKLNNVCQQWFDLNKDFFKINLIKQELNNALDCNTSYSLKEITSLHDQGYLNYFLEKKYKITIPVYDYRQWFKNTCDIKEMIASVCK